jgi:predicted  nucleic acid-binding Zn-ribbon protein
LSEVLQTVITAGVAGLAGALVRSLDRSNAIRTSIAVLQVSVADLKDAVKAIETTVQDCARKIAALSGQP